METEDGQPTPELVYEVPGGVLFCRFCRQLFHSKARLDTHERIHTGVRQSHMCELCGRGFSQAMYLKFHMQQIHGGSLEDVGFGSPMQTTSSIPPGMPSQSSTTVLDTVVRAQNSNVHFGDDMDMVDEPNAITRHGGTSCDIADTSAAIGKHQSSSGDFLDPSIGRHLNSQYQGTLDPSDALASIMDFAPLFHAEDLPLTFQEEGESVKVDDLNPSIFPNSDAADRCAEPSRGMVAAVADQPSSSQIGEGQGNFEEELSQDAFSPRNSRKQQTPQKNLRELPGQSIPIFQKTAHQVSSGFGHATDELLDMQHSPEGIQSHLANDSDFQTSHHQSSSGHTFPSNNSQPGRYEGIGTGLPRTGLQHTTMDTQHDPHGYGGLETEVPYTGNNAPQEAIASSCQQAIKVEPYTWTKQEPEDCAVNAEDSFHEQSFTACEVSSEMFDEPYLASESSGQPYTSSEMSGQPHASSEFSPEHYLSGEASGQPILNHVEAASASQPVPVSHSPRQYQGNEYTMLPPASGKKKTLVCDLCHHEFSAALYLRTHFRVVHGAEIIGIDSDEDDSEESSLTPMKRRRGRPKGSKNKPHEGSPFPQESKEKKSVGRPKGSKNKIKSGGGIHLPLSSLFPNPHVQRPSGEMNMKRSVGRPKGSKNRIKTERDVHVPLPQYSPQPYQHVPPVSLGLMSMFSSSIHSQTTPPQIPGSIPHVSNADTSPPVKRKRGRPKGSKTRKVLDNLPTSYLLPGPSSGDLTRLFPPLPCIPPISPEGPQNMSAVSPYDPSVTTVPQDFQPVSSSVETPPTVKRKRGRPKGSKSRKVVYSCIPVTYVLPSQSPLTATSLVPPLPYISPISPQGSPVSTLPPPVPNLQPTNFSPLSGNALPLGESPMPVKKKRGRPKGSKTRKVLDFLPTSYILPSQSSGEVTTSYTFPGQFSTDATGWEKRGKGRPKGGKNKPKSPSAVNPDTFSAPVPSCVTPMPSFKGGSRRPRGSKTNSFVGRSRNNSLPDGEEGMKKQPFGVKNRFLKDASSKRLIIVKFTGKANSREEESQMNSGDLIAKVKQEPVDYEPETSILSSNGHLKNLDYMSDKDLEESGHESRNVKDVNIGLPPQSRNVLQHLKNTAERDVSNKDIEPFIDNKRRKVDQLPTPEKEKNFKGLTCEICNRSVARKSDIVRHMRTHTGEKPFACKHCGKRFGDRSHLRDHLKLHSGERRYVCKVCGKAFVQSNGLVSHAAIHQERKFGCKICSKKFTRKSDVQRHIRLHAGLKPISCHVCNKRFANSSNLNSHLKMHQAPTHKCELCEKMFARKSDVNRHLRQWHKEGQDS